MNNGWLLCDFHIHTTFSDGRLPLPDIIDLYGKKGFDAIAITDHILDGTSLRKHKAEGLDPMAVEKDDFSCYLESLWQEARRAWEQYEMLVIPGAEITNNHNGYHILAIDIKQYIDPGGSVEAIVEEIHRQQGIAVAPHPHHGTTGRENPLFLWHHHDRFARLFDAWEVANRDDLFNVVGLKKFNYMANSDFHEKRHLYSWKTLLGCDKNVEAVKAEVRSNTRVSIYLFRENKGMMAM